MLLVNTLAIIHHNKSRVKNIPNFVKYVPNLPDWGDTPPGRVEVRVAGRVRGSYLTKIGKYV